MQKNDEELKKFRMMLEEAELRLSKMAYQAAVDDARKAIDAVRDARERLRRAENMMRRWD